MKKKSRGNMPWLHEDQPRPAFLAAALIFFLIACAALFLR
jgi:hypothetical protein